MTRTLASVRSVVLCSLLAFSCWEYAVAAPHPAGESAGVCQEALPGDADFVKLLISVTGKLADRNPAVLCWEGEQLRELETDVASLVDTFENDPAMLMTYLKNGFKPDPFLFSRLRSRFSFAISQESKLNLQPVLDMLEKTEVSESPSSFAGFSKLISMTDRNSTILENGRVRNDEFVLEEMLAARPEYSKSLTDEDIDFVTSEEVATNDRSLAEKVEKCAIFSSGVSFGINNSGLKARGSLTIQNPGLTFSRDEISFRGDILVNTVAGFKPSKGFHFRKTIFTVGLNPILLGFAGPVPIYVRPRLKLSVGGSVKADVGCTWNFDLTAPVQVGVRKQAGEWANISKAAVEPKNPGLKFNGNIGSLNGRLGAGVTAFFPVNDIAGPNLDVEANASTIALVTLVEKTGTLPTPFLSQMDTTVGVETSIGGAVRFLKKAHFSVTLGSIDIPVYSLIYKGFRLEPDRISLRMGEPFCPENITIFPQYSEMVLNEEKGVRELFPMVSTRGLWKSGNHEIGSGFMASVPGITNLICILNLLKSEMSGKSDNLELETVE